MSHLRVRRDAGDINEHKLSKKHPLSIGRQKSNDICIDEEGVGALHCRIAWNKKGYEAASAGKGGIDVNGTLVRHSQLQQGDIIRVGSVDVEFVDGLDESSSSNQNVQESAEIGLSPISEEDLFLDKPSEKKSSVSRRGADKGGVVVERIPEPPDEAKDNLPDDLFEEEEPERNIVLSRGDTAKPKPDRISSAARSAKSKSSDRERSSLGKLRSRRRVRPGEEDVLRSPIVLLLGTGTVVLLLLALIFYFMIGRQSSQRLYDVAEQEFQSGRYSPAIQHYDEFLETYPRHQYSDEVRRKRGMAEVLARISGATPNYAEGLQALDKFLSSNRERSDFPEYRVEGLEYAQQIAFGAAESAATSGGSVEKRRELIGVAEEVATLLRRYGGDQVTAELTARIEAAFQNARDAVLKQETFNTATAEIDRAIQQGDPMAALAVRNQLIARYSEYESDSRLSQLLARTLAAEQSRVEKEDTDREAVAEPHATGAGEPLSLVLHARARSEELSEGRTVYALAKDCCYAVDTITGQPLWRRAIGLDTPFFPLEVATTTPGLLVFDTKNRELLALERNTGALIWRQPLEELVTGRPLVHEGDIYVPTSERNLYKLDLKTGRITSRLTFSQNLASTPVLDSTGRYLFVVGSKALLYAVSLRPLEIRAVTYLGHAEGSIEAPLVSMGSLLLIADNDRAGSSQLRLLDARDPEKSLPQLAAERLNGHVRDEPILRGRELFVATDRHTIAAFSVSDDPNKRPLVPIARFQVQQEYDGPLYLTAGPDGQLWMASSAVRKFQLQTDSIQMDPKSVGIGISTQPVQMIGRNLFVGRRLPYSRGVVFTQIDRDSMTSQWRMEAGARALQTIAADNSIVTVTEGGNIYRVVPGELNQPGFKQNPVATLEVGENVTTPLEANVLGGDRLAVAAGGASPRLWMVNASGQIQGQLELEQPLQTNPIELAAGLVLPLPGRLKVVRPGSASSTVEDFLAPVGQESDAHAWMQLVRLDETQLLALDSDGRLTKLEHRTNPVENLTPVATVEFAQPIDQPIALHEGRAAIALSDGRVQVLDTSTMEPVAEIKLDSPAATPLWIVDGRLYVGTADSSLACFDFAGDMQRLWNTNLETGLPAGKPLVRGESIVVGTQGGGLLLLDASSGEPLNRLDVGQPLVGGPEPLGDFVVVHSIDGSIYRIESIFGQEQ